MKEKEGSETTLGLDHDFSKTVLSGDPSSADSISSHFIKLRNLVYESFCIQSIYAAAKLGIADILRNGPKSVSDIADATGYNTDALYRLLRALASLGIFKETTNRIFELTPMAELLQDKHPLSLRPLLMLVGDPTWRGPWGNIMYSIKTGEAAFEYTFKKSIFDYFREHEEAMELFQKYLTVFSIVNCPVIAASYPFSDFNKVIDIGGGRGSLLAHILRQHPSVHGVLFDMPEVVRGPNEIDKDIALRCELVGGDFFKAVPEGGDLYIMQQIIHDWNDELATIILANCRKAMVDNGKLLVVDAVLAPGNSQDLNKFMDIHMLLGTTGGRERTESEFQKLFNDAGLKLTRVISTASLLSYSIVEGEKI